MHLQDNVTTQLITETLELNYMPYAMSVIVSRAIPEIDGFKPAHRKLLYTMYKMGLMTGGRVKSADVVGQTMQLNPHGDGAIYETLVRLTRGNAALLHPFIDSKGNFGKQYSRDMAYAASRYTEVKLDGICSEIFKDIDKNTVDFTDNYNATTKEPTLLPTTFPNILVTPNQGIAVGMASNIASFNLKEVCEATVAYIKNSDCDLTEVLIAPDFSTGAELLYDKKQLESIYETGRGSLKLRSKYSFDKKNSCIEVTEIPYTTTIEQITDKIVALIKSGKIKEINDVRDETDLNGLKITIEVKRNTDADKLMQRLFSLTPLEDSFSCNFNILIHGKPRIMGVREILKEWLEFRINCIKRQLSFEIDSKTQELHLLTGLGKILLDIDRAIKIVRDTEDDEDVIPNLMQGFDIDKEQAEYVAQIRLRNLNKRYILNKTNELQTLAEDIQNLKDILSDQNKIKNLICKQLKEISKKYGKPRFTQAVRAEEAPDLTEFINDYPLKVFLTKEGYFKKISLASYRSGGEQYLKEGDSLIQELDATNKAELLMFSDKFNVYKMKLHEMPDCKASGLGEYLPNLLKSEDSERIIFLAATCDYEGYMIFGFENGKVAKVLLKSYETKMNRKKLINAYSNKSKLIFADYTESDRDYAAFRNYDKATLFNTELIPLNTTKNSAGVQVFTLKKNSTMSLMLRPENGTFQDNEYYRTAKIPSTGHFLAMGDKIGGTL